MRMLEVYYSVGGGKYLDSKYHFIDDTNYSGFSLIVVITDGLRVSDQST